MIGPAREGERVTITGDRRSGMHWAINCRERKKEQTMVGEVIY